MPLEIHTTPSVCEKHHLKIHATPSGVGGMYFVGCNKCYFGELTHSINQKGRPPCAANHRGEFTGTPDLERITCPFCWQMTEIMRALARSKNG